MMLVWQCCSAAPRHQCGACWALAGPGLIRSSGSLEGDVSWDRSSACPLAITGARSRLSGCSRTATPRCAVGLPRAGQERVELVARSGPAVASRDLGRRQCRRCDQDSSKSKHEWHTKRSRCGRPRSRGGESRCWRDHRATAELGLPSPGESSQRQKSDKSGLRVQLLECHACA